jgi:hypothetical protein
MGWVACAANPWPRVARAATPDGLGGSPATPYFLLFFLPPAGFLPPFSLPNLLFFFLFSSSIKNQKNKTKKKKKKENATRFFFIATDKPPSPSDFSTKHSLKNRF